MAYVSSKPSWTWIGLKSACGLQDKAIKALKKHLSAKDTIWSLISIIQYQTLCRALSTQRSFHTKLQNLGRFMLQQSHRNFRNCTQTTLHCTSTWVISATLLGCLSCISVTKECYHYAIIYAMETYFYAFRRPIWLHSWHFYHNHGNKGMKWADV